jgi:hypothetical protein
MSNCVFGFPIYSDPSPLYTPVLSGGGWSASLPVTNVQDRRLSRLARSTSAGSGFTTFNIDLLRVCPIGVFAALIPNLTKSSTPQVEFYVGTAPGFNDIYHPGAQQAWPTGVTADDVIGPDGTPQNVWCVLIPAAPVSGRYINFTVFDTANADGYLDVARVIIAGAYRPSRPLSVGVRSQLENDTVRTKTEGGATLYRAMPTSRVDTFSLANIPESEALTSIRRMQHRLGTSGPLFFVLDETDPYRYMRSYQGTLRQLGALEYPDSLLYNTIGFEVAEDL